MTGKVGIDNYGLYPLGLDPLETLQWAIRNGAEGVAFSGLDDKGRAKCTDSYLKEIRAVAEDNGMYLEWGNAQHVPSDLRNYEKKNIRDLNKRALEEASRLGTGIVRSCSGGLRRWNAESIPTIQLMYEMAEELTVQLPMLGDHGEVLAVETHFEFTTFELIRVFEWCGVKPGDCLGICLDTMNLLTMLEDPVSAAERILPWVVSTHIKDGGILMSDKGLRSFPCPMGKGVVDNGEIIKMLDALDHEVNLSLEDHGGAIDLPIFDSRFLLEFPDLSSVEMTAILELAGKTNGLIETGSIVELEREKWPEVCEDRLKQGLGYLKKITNG